MPRQTDRTGLGGAEAGYASMKGGADAPPNAFNGRLVHNVFVQLQ